MNKSILHVDISEQDEEFQAAIEALHILPLRVFPLVTVGLRSANLIKDSHFRGMVELFSGRQSGRGLILPTQLGSVFEMTNENRGDFELIKKLSILPSYDIYSLRIALRQQKIDFDDNVHLQLGKEREEKLQTHMNMFLRPLTSAIFGASFQSADSFGRIVSLIDVQNLEAAKDNLLKLSRSINVEITAIPEFLKNYSDVFMSLAYYKSCLDEHRDAITDFLETLSMVSVDPNLRYNAPVVEMCVGTHKALKAAVDSITHLIDTFGERTTEMWTNMSLEKFQKMRQMIEAYHTGLGAALCIIAVKMTLWIKKFPEPDVGGLRNRADFIMSDMRYGMENLGIVQASAA